MKNKRKLLKALGIVSGILVIVGALNWGLVALNPTWNLVEMFLGSYPIFLRLVYGLVGLSGLYQIYNMFQR